MTNDPNMLWGRYFPCGCWQSFIVDAFGQVEFCVQHQLDWSGEDNRWYPDPKETA